MIQHLGRNHAVSKEAAEKPRLETETMVYRDPVIRAVRPRMGRYRD
jgi:hypothetical protein